MRSPSEKVAIPHAVTQRILPLLALALLAACAPPRTGPHPSTPVFPGFDTARYPGDSVLETWRRSSPYLWVGYYLPSPCHRDASWSGKRETIERLGWGVAIIYVGQQAFENDTASAAAPLPAPVVCSRTLLTAEQGLRDARDAATRAEQEGFARGSVIYLDVERMQRVSPAMIAYYQAWITGLLADGRYRPGTYAHRANAAELYLLAQTAHREAGSLQDTPFWVAGGQGFTLEQAPGRSGLPFADLWQGAIDVDRSWAGVSLRLDENVADRPSPSAPLLP